MSSRDEMKYRDVRPAVRVSVATHRAGFVQGQISKFEISVRAGRARGKKACQRADMNSKARGLIIGKEVDGEESAIVVRNITYWVWMAMMAK